MDIQNVQLPWPNMRLPWREVGTPEGAASFHGNVLGYSGKMRATLHAIKQVQTSRAHDGEPPSWDVTARCGFDSYVSAHPYSTGTFSQDPATCGRCQYLLEQDEAKARTSSEVD